MQYYKKRIRPIRREEKKEPQKSSFRKYAKLFWSIIVGIGVILGLLQLWPSVSVTVDKPLEKSEPYTTPFLIKNESIYQIKIISITVFTKNIKANTKNIKNLVINNSSTTTYFLEVLDPNKSIHTISNLIHGIPISFVSKADISISVLFKPVFINLTFQDDFNYTFYVNSDGNIKWYPK